MRALLDHVALAEHDDLVGITDGRQSVRDDDARLRASLDQLIKSLLHLMLRLGIEGTRCLIKQDDLWLPDESPGNGDTLLLATREAHASLTHERVKALWEEQLVLDESERVGLATGFLEAVLDLLLGEAGDINAVEDVVADAA